MSADALLQRERELLAEVAGVLQREHAALLAAEVASLPAFAEDKARICAELEDIERQLAAAGSAQDPARRDGIRELARQVAEANLRNGVVVSALMRNTQGALDILRGIPGAPPLYGPGGTPARSAGKALGQA